MACNVFSYKYKMGTDAAYSMTKYGHVNLDLGKHIKEIFVSNCKDFINPKCTCLEWKYGSHLAIQAIEIKISKQP